jgi:hypothetical protein
MKDHVATLAGLGSIVLILGTAVVMTVHGIKEDALLIILLTGAVEIGKAIVGIKPPAAPGAKINGSEGVIATTTPPAANTPGEGTN